MLYVGKAFIGEAGQKNIESVTANDVRRTFAKWDSYARTTRYKRATLFRRMLRDLRDMHGLPRLWDAVPRVTAAPPRDVTATAKERTALLSIAPPHLRCLIMLCWDLAIRSGTAIQLGPQHYDAERARLSFTTKYDARVDLPVPPELAKLVDDCHSPTVPFVTQLNPHGHAHLNNLRASFRRLCKKAGITRRITLHDLRRSTAVRVQDETRDLRLVQAVLGHRNLQSTLHYLDHRMTRVPDNLLTHRESPTDLIQ